MIKARHIAIILCLLSSTSWAQMDSTSIYLALDQWNVQPSTIEKAEALRNLLDNAKELAAGELIISIKRELGPTYFDIENDYEGLRQYQQIVKYYEKTGNVEALYTVYLELSEYYRLKKLPKSSSDQLWNS